MFTGIIEEVGLIKDIKLGRDSAVLLINANLVLKDLNIGDSVAVNGICLTVTQKNENSFKADMMSETLKRTVGFKKGDFVNLERAMKANGRFGGHIVSGHIDGCGKIKNLVKNDNAVIYTIKAPKNILDYIVEKGSITIDGISLTVVNVSEAYFTVSVIPHTQKITTLSKKRIGDGLNLEVDIIGKYVKKFLSSNESSNNNSSYINNNENNSCYITQEYLKNNGF